MKITNPRYTVKKHGDNSDYFSVIDNEHKRWNMPEMAITLYFGDFGSALQIAGLLNKEWLRFLRNPK